MTTLLTRPQVEELLGFSTSTLYRLMARKLFPRPVRIGQRAVRWRSADLEAWMGARPYAGGGEPETRTAATG